MARHLADIHRIANLPFLPIKAEPRSKRPGTSGGCPSPDAALVATELKGPFVERITGCTGQDGPFDAEWDMMNSAVGSLAVCLDCDRPRDDRFARCRSAEDRLKSARKTVQKTVEERAGR